MPPARLLPTVDPATEEQAQASVLKTLLATAQHFFGGFSHFFAHVRDPRRPEWITYPLAAVLFTGVLTPALASVASVLVCRLGARRQMNYTRGEPRGINSTTAEADTRQAAGYPTRNRINLMFRANAPSASKFEALFQVAGCPHGDTLDATFSRLQPSELQAVVTGLTETLIRCKVLYPDRLLGHYYLVAIDGTGVLVFTERHCAQCLTRTQRGVTTYYHPILEATLVTTTGLAFSLMAEFIENPTEYPTKQDCELKAFYRLTERLKQRFPRLPIGLLLDGLFAGGPTFTRCEPSGWKYLITLQDGDLPSVHHDFEALMTLAPETHLNFTPSGYPPTPQAYRWMNDMTCVDTEHQTHCLVSVKE